MSQNYAKINVVIHTEVAINMNVTVPKCSSVVSVDVGTSRYLYNERNWIPKICII